MNVRQPGLFDLQVNGFAGVDFNSPGLPSERIALAMAAMRATGVTRSLPTFITSSREHFAACVRPFVELAGRHGMCGFHMEGPYINPTDGPRGAHPLDAVVDASVEDFRWRQEAADGRIVLVTLAPEVPGALALTEYLVGQGVKVAIGHSDATAEQIRAAVMAGATLSTHLGNGSHRVLAKHGNLITEQLAADELTATFIVDGHHLPAASVKTMIRAKTPARSVLVTDAVAAAGCPPGRYQLGNELVELAPDGRVSQPGKWHLAGSSLRLDQAIANTVRMTGMPLEAVWPLASTQAAAAVGMRTAGQVVADWDAAAGALTVLSIVGD